MDEERFVPVLGTEVVVLSVFVKRRSYNIVHPDQSPAKDIGAENDPDCCQNRLILSTILLTDMQLQSTVDPERLLSCEYLPEMGSANRGMVWVL